MKCLIVVANPSDTSFTNALVARFKAGLDSAGHDYDSINLFQDDYPNNANLDKSYRRKILEADAICFAFPWWFEMPPFPLAAFFQRNLVEGFAFRHEEGRRVPLLHMKVQVLITMGQASPEYNIYCVREGLRYTGLKINNELVALNVGPRLDPAQAQEYLNRAELAGKTILQK